MSMPPLLVEQEIAGKKAYVWRTDLRATKQFWEEWFKGLTNAFLNVHLPKALITSGNERLDTALTIAQMQGKYKLEVIPEVGHVIHEDKPERFAKCLDDFISNFKILEKAHDHQTVTTLSGKVVIINN